MKQKKKTVHTYSLMDEMMASPTAPMPQDKRVYQLTRMRQGLHALETLPNPSLADWQVCADAVNLLEALVILEVAEDKDGLLLDAIEALAKAGTRHLHHKVPIRLDGPGMQTVRAVLEDYSEVLAEVPARMMIKAHRLAERKIQERLKSTVVVTKHVAT